jgi:RND family efflux transporter MFP subunit
MAAALCFLRPALAQTAVETAVLTPATWRTQVEIAGSLLAPQSAVLSPARGGVVSTVSFQSGDAVAKGQVLVQLQAGPEQAQLALDDARLAQAQRDFARTQKLMSIAGSSQSVLEQAAAAASEAKAQVALDEASLAQTQIIAPFAGHVGIRNLDPGDYLQAGQAALTLTATGPLRVEFAVPQTEAGDLARGNAFTFTAPQTEGAATAPGYITALSPALDTTTDARPVEGRIDAAGALLPGMSGVVSIATGAPLPAFAVPSTALNDSTLGAYLFVLQPAGGATYTLATVYVTILGTRGDRSFVSTNGLQAGADVVAIGGFKLTDGASVTLQNP